MLCVTTGKSVYVMLIILSKSRNFKVRKKRDRRNIHTRSRIQWMLDLFTKPLKQFGSSNNTKFFPKNFISKIIIGNYSPSRHVRCLAPTGFTQIVCKEFVNAENVDVT